MPPTHRYKTVTTDFAPIKVKAFVQDPLVAKTDELGLVELRLPGEAALGPGPTTGRVEVIDEDEEGNHIEDPVQPWKRGGGFSVGRGNPERSFRHHQVNVWAHIVRTLGILEDSKMFGRRIEWAFPGGRIAVRPHAFEEQNAYYDREAGAIHFGYFTPEGAKSGEVIYSCLSHDIITHELGHAVLDGLKPLYYELESPDVAGFHEYFGDAISMVSSLTLRDVVKHVVKERKSKLTLRNLVSDIALQFGSDGSSGNGGQPLRSAGNRRKMSDLEGVWEEHDYSEVLTGAFYDLLSKLYSDFVKRRRKSLKKDLKDGQVVVGALIAAAETTSRMMLRALDYCPPCGLTYLDYARAIVRADEVAYPLDERKYRQVLGEVLLAREIVSSTDELRSDSALNNSDVRAFDILRISANPTDAYVFVDANRKELGIPDDVNLQLSRIYRTKKVSSGRYYPPQEIVVEFSWPTEVRLTKALRQSLGIDEATLWCGGTIVFDTNGNILHYVAKTATSTRKSRLLDYLKDLDASGGFMGMFQAKKVNGLTCITKKARLRHSRPISHR